MELIVVSGRSGAGKSTALNALEDAGFNCIDNFPVRLLDALVADAERGERLAVCIDARNPRPDLERLPDALASIDCRIVYLDACSSTLVKRFSETRRRHPLTGADTDLRQAIDRERALLEPIAGLADLAIDTTATSVPQLIDAIKTRVAGDAERGISLLFRSFAFKSGVPVDADFVFDVRCLPNPYWQPHLRAFDGNAPPVRAFLAAAPEAQDMLRDIRAFLESWIPRFAADNRRYVSVAIGCTGGYHRSVYIAGQLAEHFRDAGQCHAETILLRHRDLPAAELKA